MRLKDQGGPVAGTTLAKTQNAIYCTGSACVEKFREWEKINRVARQMNLIMCSANEFPGNKPPPGFDGLMSKPFKPSTLTSILEKCSSNRKVSLL